MTAIRDDVNNSAIIGVGFGLTFVVVFLIFILEAWSMKLDTEMSMKKKGTPASLSEYKAEQAKKLGEYGWVDQGQNQVHIPIERAMELTLEQLGKK